MTSKSTLRWMQRGVVLLLILLCSFFKGYSQNDVAAKAVSITAKKITYDELFDQIRKQTGITIWYNGELGKKTVKDLNYKNTPLREVLNKVLPKDISWRLKDDEVIISKKGITLDGNVNPKDIPSKATTMSGNTAEDLVDIDGKVSDDGGNPIPGATILVKGTSTGVSASQNGQYKLSNVKLPATLVVTNIGYKKAEVVINGRSADIKLAEDVSGLDEAVIIGYGKSSRRMLTSSVEKVTSRELGTQPIGNVVAGLAAIVPGLQVTQNSGAPGRRFTVLLRGKNSIANGNTPLFIVDGMPFLDKETQDNLNIGSGVNSVSSPLNAINPSDIETIEVLKDADATAIYGSRGANGVILINTKKGRVGKSQYGVLINRGIGNVGRTIPLMNSSQYLQMRREAYNNDNISSYPANAYDLNGKWDTTRYTDWQKMLIGGTAQYTDGQMNLSGGDPSTQYYLSAGYHKETTVYPGSFKDERGTFSSSISHKSTDNKFRLSINSLFSINQNKLPQLDPKTSIFLPPVAPPVYDSLGNLNWAGNSWFNPFGDLRRTTEARSNFVNIGGLIAFTPFKGVTIQSNVGYRVSNLEQYVLSPKAAYNPFYKALQSSSSKAVSRDNGWNIEPQITYDVTIKQSKLSFLVGETFMMQGGRSDAISGSGFSNDNLLKDFRAATIKNIFGITSTVYKYNALFGRINYQLKNRYILNISGRRDGSSRFGKGKQFANFYAIGGAWIFSDEDVIAKLFPVLSYGKIHSSYGITGSDKIGDYNYLDTYTSYFSTYGGATTLIPSRLPNAQYAWEINKKFELGVDFGFLNDRLLFQLNHYRNRSSNQLLSVSVPATTGMGSIIRNLPATVQNTGLELTLSGTAIRNDKFSWNINAYLTIPRNKLISYPDIENSVHADLYSVGKSLFVTRSLKYTGVDKQSGIYQFADLDKNGAIEYPNDWNVWIFTGQQFFGGLKQTFNYKSLQLDLLFQYVRQTSVPNFVNQFLNPGSIQNQPIYVLDRWQSPNQSGTYQRYTTGINPDASDASYYFRNSTGAYSNGSFLRCKNLQFSYQVPLSQKHGVNIKELKVFAQAQNLFTLTRYEGFDPETLDALPPLRIVSLGLSLKL